MNDGIETKTIMFNRNWCRKYKKFNFEPNPEFNPERLRAARLWRNLSIRELSELTQIYEQVLSLYEYGDTEIIEIVAELRHIEKIAIILRFPLKFFYQIEKKIKEELK